jgi:hypothetical protein
LSSYKWYNPYTIPLSVRLEQVGGDCLRKAGFTPISVYVKVRVGAIVAQALLLAASTLVSRADLARFGRVETSLDAAD